MINKIVIISALSILTVSACVDTTSVANNMASKYVGTNTDKFFIEHGAPTGKHQLNNGDMMWTWDSGVSVVNIPQATSINGTNYGGMANYTATSYGGNGMKLQCVVQILSDRKGKIKSISIHRDTIGHWTTSMCHEIFE